MPDSGIGVESPVVRVEGDPVRLAAALQEQCARLAPLVTKRSLESPTGPSSEALWAYEARVPALYRKATWDRVQHRGIRAYGEKVKEHVEAGRSLLILGGVGLGKSSAAGLICEDASQEDLIVGWAYVPDLVDGLLEPKMRQEIVRSQVSPDLLVWDDFGVERMADWQVPLLDRIVERRYRLGKPMVVTANLTPKQLFDAADAAMLRMADRWRDRGFMAILKGASYRATA